MLVATFRPDNSLLEHFAQDFDEKVDPLSMSCAALSDIRRIGIGVIAHVLTVVQARVNEYLLFYNHYYDIIMIMGV